MLAQILDHKRQEIACLHETEWIRRAADSAKPRPFLSLDSTRTSRPKGRPSLIAEIKRASPSRGVLAATLDPIRQARLYTENGAAAISVLTDEKFFQGSVKTIFALRYDPPRKADGNSLPLLRKDFLLAPVQIHQSRAIGADAVLLIVAALANGTLAELHALALELELTPLVEVHTEDELERALRIPGLRWIGVNNRDLATFEVRLQTCLELGPRIPPGVGAVAESGIFTAEDARHAGEAGFDAILVGEALITAPDVAAKVRELAGAPHPPSPHSAKQNGGR